MLYNINIRAEYKELPSPEILDTFTDTLIGIVDNYCDNCERSFIINTKPVDVNKNEFRYDYQIEVDANKVLDSKELFSLFTFDYPKIGFVTIFEKRFNPYAHSNAGYFWTNEGMTTYRDGGTYIDPFYRFHTPEGSNYEVVYIPVYARKFQPRDKDHYEKHGATYMWKCTTCWDNWMKATTIDEAIEEFENIYKKKLWSSVEGYKRELDKAIDKFAAFDEYLWSKK